MTSRKEVEYSSQFEEIVLIDSVKYELNWLSLGTKFKKQIRNINEFINKQIKKIKLIKLIFVLNCNYVWYTYCEWFNSKFNKQEK